jgi:transposase
MRKNLFWLSDEQWGRIKPHLPTDVRGVERVDDRRVVSGIVHVPLGRRWKTYGPPRRQVVFAVGLKQSAQTYPAFRLCR